MSVNSCRSNQRVVWERQREMERQTKRQAEDRQKQWQWRQDKMPTHPTCCTTPVRIHQVSSAWWSCVRTPRMTRYSWWWGTESSSGSQGLGLWGPGSSPHRTPTRPLPHRMGSDPRHLGEIGKRILWRIRWCGMEWWQYCRLEKLNRIGWNY